MFGLESNTRYFMCQHPVNMRKGIDSLFNLVVSESPMSPMTGDVFMFFSKNRQSVKFLKWDTMSATIDELRKEVASLENLLKERDENLDKANAQMRGMKATFLPKKSEKLALSARPQTREEKDAAEKERKAKIKARGNNGAKRKDYFAVETKEEDVYPQDLDLNTSVAVGVRDVIRYEMIRPSFVKHIYHIHTLRCGDVIASGKAPSAPLQNSRFDGSFIAGIAELRYLYSMPVERIVKYFQGNGFDLDKQTAYGLLKKTAELFDNLNKAADLPHLSPESCRDLLPDRWTKE